MVRLAAAVACVALVAGCASDSGSGVVDTVLQDFGIKDRPEGYQSGSDKVFGRLSEVGTSELKRLNAAGRHGVIKFDEGDGVRGKYYKEVKVYENFYPSDAQRSGTGPVAERGYAGYIEYAYRIYQGRRCNNRTEAQAELSTIPTEERGRETLRYQFSSGGVWLGGDGQKVDAQQ